MFAFLSAFSLSAPALADTTTQAKLDLIASLAKQIQALQAQLVTLNQQKTSAEVSLINTLKLGSKGDDVKVLQALLAADPSIYPEGIISGLFGPATARAVKRFQKKHDLEQVGNVGKKTLAKLNEMLEKDDDRVALEGSDDKKTPCVAVPPGHLVAPGWLRKNGGVKPIVPVCQVLPPGIAAKLGLATSTPPTPPPPPSPGDQAPPTISSLTASSITSGSAIVSWTTNEASTGKVYYATSSTIDFSSATAFSNTSFDFSHSFSLGNLASSTTYYYQVVSKDLAGNTATSSIFSFATLQGADVSAPVISSVASGSITSSGATITWTTNESSKTKVYYGVNSPLNLSGSSSYVDNTFVTSHTAVITSLGANTTYYYVVESDDAAGNIATSTQYSFVTAPPPDTIPPIISLISSNTASSTATVSWTTNENSTSKVYYDTGSVNFSSSPTVSDSSLNTSHYIYITGLATSTMYNYVVESKDAGNNTATSSQQSFATSAQ